MIKIRWHLECFVREASITSCTLQIVYSVKFSTMIFVITVLWNVLLAEPKYPVSPISKTLHHNVMSTYEKLIKPSGGLSQQLTVKMGMRLSQVINVVSVLIMTN